MQSGNQLPPAAPRPPQTKSAEVPEALPSERPCTLKGALAVRCVMATAEVPLCRLQL